MPGFFVLPGFLSRRSSCRNDSYLALFGCGFQKRVDENQNRSAPVPTHRHPTLFKFAVLIIDDGDSQRNSETLGGAIKAVPVLPQVLFGLDRVPLESIAHPSPTPQNESRLRGWPRQRVSLTAIHYKANQRSGRLFRTPRFAVEEKFRRFSETRDSALQGAGAERSSTSLTAMSVPNGSSACVAG